MTEPNTFGKIVSSGSEAEPPENGHLDHGVLDASIFEHGIGRAGR